MSLLLLCFFWAVTLVVGLFSNYWKAAALVLLLLSYYWKQEEGHQHQQQQPQHRLLPSERSTAAATSGKVRKIDHFLSEKECVDLIDLCEASQRFERSQVHAVGSHSPFTRLRAYMAGRTLTNPSSECVDWQRTSYTAFLRKAETATIADIE